MSVCKLLMIKMKVGKEEGRWEMEKRVKVREGRDERATKSGGEEIRERGGEERRERKGRGEDGEENEGEGGRGERVWDKEG